MMKRLLYILFLVLYLPISVSAIEPIKINNKFGVHLAVPSDKDLENASRLVNASAGKWGYVTLVIADNDMSVDKWQGVFDKMRVLQLIPIIRLATHPEGENWVAANPEDSDKWVAFLNSLNWVIKNRYIILFNEPNHATEWGGKTSPEEYGEVALEFAKKLKKVNKDYFVMLAGLDQSAPQQPPRFMNEGEYLRKTIETIGPNNFTKYFDGLSSHSYPNPGFSSSPYNTGWGSIRGYENELAYLSELGIDKELPVFITETGWTRTSLSEQTVADYFVWAHNNIWLPDSRVVAITPFILNYQSEPFLDFSFQKFSSDEFYSQFSLLSNIHKISGRPIQIEKAKFLNQMPKQLVQDSSFMFELSILNLGQSIWDKKDNYEFRLISDKNYFYKFSDLDKIEPNKITKLKLEFHTPEKEGQSKVRIGLFLNDELKLSSDSFEIDIVPLQDLSINYRLLWFDNSGSDFQVELYDRYENLVYLARNVVGKKGKMLLKKVRNVALEETYRVVLLKPGYLPRQSFVVFGKGQNLVKMKPMWRLDFNKDGRLGLNDFIWFLD